MKIAVTGGTGFIGSHLIPALLAAGHQVTALVEIGDAGMDGVENIPVEVTSGEGLTAGLSGVEGVVHLAARNHVLRETRRDPLSAYRKVNVEGTANVLTAARRGGAKWFIHFSSVKAIAEGGGSVLDENSPCHPVTAYGISKLESEQVVRRFSEEHGLHTVILRLPMVYGPGNKGNLPRMIRWAESGYPFPVFHPENLRSMVYVGNVVAGIMAILKASPPASSTYILKDREDYSTRMVYSAICNALGKKPRYLPIPSAVVLLGGMLSDDFRKITGSFRVSSAKFVRDTNFTPPFSLEEGITRTVDWHKRSAR